MLEENKFLSWLKRNEADIVLVVGIILIALISFGGGWLMASNQLLKDSNLVSAEGEDKVQIEEVEFRKKSEPVEIASQNQENSQVVNSAGSEEKEEDSQGLKKNTSSSVSKNATSSNKDSNCKYVGSKNSDVYHLPDCPGAQRIKEENKKCFDSKAEAEKAGYRAAKNCPGL